jgi:serine-type D-Ala-D-Ala carboxypeptidase (penicillin-binding protein 5/6)
MTPCPLIRPRMRPSVWALCAVAAALYVTPSAAQQPGQPRPAQRAPAKERPQPKPVEQPQAATLDSRGVPIIETAAPFAYMVDITTGAVLLDKNATKLMFPSSMTKMMTSYIVFDKIQKGELKMSDTFPVSQNAWRKGGAVSDSSTMFLELNSRASVQDLVQGVVVQSGNDACIVLAEGLSGSEEAFAEEMNRRAKAMGLTQTNFKNSTGYPDPEHYSTARDLAILAKRTIEDHPEFYKYYAQRDFTYNGKKQENRNTLLSRGTGVDGLKTGHTLASGFGLTSSASRDGRRLIVVVNGLNTMRQRAEESERLLDFGFREFENYTLFRANDQVEPVDVWLGTERQVMAMTTGPVLVTLPRRLRKDLKVVASFTSPIPAPIARGDRIGVLKATVPGLEPMEYPLVAVRDVPELSMVGRVGATMSYLVFGAGK